jgi:hypothetical protein
MHFPDSLRIGLGISLAALAVCCVCAQDPSTTPKDSKDTAKKDTRPSGAVGLPPRVSPTDYRTSEKAGKIIIAADFTQHSVPTVEQLLTTEDYVVVEVGMYGSADARTVISLEDFTLRINNNKKTMLHAQSFVVVLASLKDPEWVAPEELAAKKSSSTSIGGGGGNDQGNLPPIIHVPIELQRAMALHIQKASLPLGDRPLPQAGLLFFPYRGRAEKINAVTLYYAGPAGKATLDLE